MNEVDLFFQSIAGIVKKLPSKGVNEARLQVLKIVSELEEKYLINNVEPTIMTLPTTFRTTSSLEHNYSSSPSPSPSSSSNSRVSTPYV